MPVLNALKIRTSTTIPDGMPRIKLSTKWATKRIQKPAYGSGAEIGALAAMGAVGPPTDAAVTAVPTSWPQVWQNRLPSPTSLPHRVQNMIALHSGQGLRL
jgi:hypothetical protein